MTATILKMSVCGIQQRLMCLNCAMCCLPAMAMQGTNLLIRKHSLQLVVWKCYSACPDLLIDLSHLILKYVACVLVEGSPLVDLDISGTDWCWCVNTDVELDLSFH